MTVLALGVCAPAMMGQMGGAQAVAPGTAVDPAKAMDMLLATCRGHVYRRGQGDAGGEIWICAEQGDLCSEPDG